MIEAKDLRFAYPGQRPVFEGLSFRADDGELLRLCGVSGCGKTTLLHCLCGVIPRDIGGSLSGTVSIDGRAVTGLSPAELPRFVSIVFQEPGSRMFLPTLRDEIAFTLENLCIPPDEMETLIYAALAETGLAPLAVHSPDTLSGGQRKLAAFACAAALPPRVILLDEITAGLDGEAVIILKRCVDLLRKQGTAVILSDHRGGIWPEARGIYIEDFRPSAKGGS